MCIRDRDKVVALANFEEVLGVDEQEIQFLEGVGRWLGLLEANAEVERLKKHINDRGEEGTVNN